MKRKLYSYLNTHFDIRKSKKKDYDFDITIENKIYQLKVIYIPRQALITVNSPTIWEVSTGRVSGIRYIKKSTDFINFNGFHKEENKIVFLTNRPYKILQAINESEIIDVSEQFKVRNTYILYDFEDFKKI